MANRLPSWVFIGLAMLLIGAAMLPLMRALFGVDETIQIQFFTVVGLLLAGLMCGLTGMLLLVKRQPDIVHADVVSQVVSQSVGGVTKLHACGLLLFTGIPLANFLLCYLLWVKNRHKSIEIDRAGREAICFQISIYLYLLLSLFMTFVVIGVLAIPLLLTFHLLGTIVAIYVTLKGRAFRYPANISIINLSPRTMVETNQSV